MRMTVGLFYVPHRSLVDNKQSRLLV